MGRLRKIIFGIGIFTVFSIALAMSLPRNYSGTWTLDDESESGAIALRVDPEVEQSDTVRGQVSVTLKKYCSGSVPFEVPLGNSGFRIDVLMHTTCWLLPLRITVDIPTISEGRVSGSFTAQGPFGKHYRGSFALDRAP